MENLASIKGKLFFSIGLLLVAFAIPFLCLGMPAWALAYETNSTWFQRSGSLVVLFAALSEFLLLKTYDYISPSEAAYVVPFDTPKWYKTLYNVIAVAGVFLLVAGTLIWGYGDYIHDKI
jgi:hypothetical protein